MGEQVEGERKRGGRGESADLRGRPLIRNKRYGQRTFLLYIKGETEMILNDDIKKILVSEETIEETVKRIAAQIDRDYAKSTNKRDPHFRQRKHHP